MTQLTIKQQDLLESLMGCQLTRQGTRRKIPRKPRDSYRLGLQLTFEEFEHLIQWHMPIRTNPDMRQRYYQRAGFTPEQQQAFEQQVQEHPGGHWQTRFKLTNGTNQC
jgi:hypothetical protein